MRRIAAAWGLAFLTIAAVPAAAAGPGADECPFPGPWSLLADARPECADAWRAELEEAAAAWAEFAERELVVHEDCHEFPPRAVHFLAPVPHPDCVASWAEWTAATGTFVAGLGVDYAAAWAAYAASNAADSDGDALPQLVENDVCGRRLVSNVVTDALGLGSCNGYGDYVAPA